MISRSINSDDSGTCFLTDIDLAFLVLSHTEQDVIMPVIRLVVKLADEVSGKQFRCSRAGDLPEFSPTITDVGSIKITIGRSQNTLIPFQMMFADFFSDSLVVNPPKEAFDAEYNLTVRRVGAVATEEVMVIITGNESIGSPIRPQPNHGVMLFSVRCDEAALAIERYVVSMKIGEEQLCLSGSGDLPYRPPAVVHNVRKVQITEIVTYYPPGRVSLEQVRREQYYDEQAFLHLAIALKTNWIVIAMGDQSP